MDKYSLCKWVNKGNGSIIVSETMEEKIVTVKVPYPCLLYVERSIFIPRMLLLKLKIIAKKKDIEVLTLQHMLGQNEKNYGLAGSATKVEKIFPSIFSAIWMGLFSTAAIYYEIE